MSFDTRINEILGAKIFQKYVFKIEDLKYKIIDLFFKDAEKNYEKKLRLTLDKELSKTQNDEEKSELIRNYQNKILTSRKENNNKKNRNYHIDKDNPLEFINYLNKNKSIHINGLIKNGIYFLLIATLIFQGNTLALIGKILLPINIISTFINFECVNLQNYNLKRFEKNREKFEELQKRKEQRDLKRYKEISEVVSAKIKSQEDILNIEDIIHSISTKEQLEEMRSLLKN